MGTAARRALYRDWVASFVVSGAVLGVPFGVWVQVPGSAYLRRVWVEDACGPCYSVLSVVSRGISGSIEIMPGPRSAVDLARSRTPPSMMAVLGRDMLIEVRAVLERPVALPFVGAVDGVVSGA